MFLPIKSINKISMYNVQILLFCPRCQCSCFIKIKCNRCVNRIKGILFNAKKSCIDYSMYSYQSETNSVSFRASKPGRDNAADDSPQGDGPPWSSGMWLSEQDIE